MGATTNLSAAVAAAQAALNAALAAEKTIQSVQSGIIHGMFKVGHNRRSSASVADAINEDVATAERALVASGYKFRYTGKVSKKRYFGPVTA